MIVRLARKLNIQGKSAFAVMLSLVLGSASACLMADTVNLLANYNPGFETSGSGVPQWNSQYGSFSVVSGTYHTGSKSLLCGTNCQINSSLAIPVEPGYQYKIGVWGKYSNFTFTNYYGMGFGLLQKRSDGGTNGNWYDMMCYLDYPAQENASKDWFYAESAPVIPKETTTTLTPTIKIQASAGQVWFDDIVVWKEPVPDRTLETFVNIIENGSFEVRFASGTKPNGYTVVAPQGMYDTYFGRMNCVEDIHLDRVASLKIDGECTVVSNAGYANTNRANAKIGIKTVGVTGTGAYAKLVFYNDIMTVIGTRDIAALTGTNDWQYFTSDLSNIDTATRYIQWEIGMKSGSAGSAYFDDLQVNTPTTLQVFPYRTKDTSHASVTVDCTARKAIFTSPLNAFDTGGAWLAYSPTILTAGKYLEGPGRWYNQRSRLGVKYVRLHDVYDPGCWSISNDANGKWVLCTASGRTKYPISTESFPGYYSVDGNGVAHCDFSVLKHMLDTAVLQSGCKPILGFGPVPRCIAWDWNPQYVPASPDSWNKWEDFNYQFVKFLVDTYGADEVRTWIFETGNEPSTVFTFRGDPTNPGNIMNDFFKLQDYAIHGATRALPDIFIAGPSGPPEAWIDPMLTHCATGTNYFTGQVGTKIDAISVHGYLGGSGGDMSWRQAEDQLLRYLGYIDRYYQLTGKQLKLFNTEFSPIHIDGGANLAGITHERNNHIQAIASMHTAFFSHRLGVESLAFFYESPSYMSFITGVPMNNIPEFLGLSTMISSHGIFNPICRSFEMLSKLNGANEVIASADKDPIFALATATDSQIRVLCYSFDVDPKLNYTTSVDISVNPASIGTTFNATRYILSSTKANSWYLAQQRNLTQADCAQDSSIVDQINNASELAPEPCGQVTTSNGRLNLNVSMPAYSAVLYVLDKVN